MRAYFRHPFTLVTLLLVSAMGASASALADMAASGVSSRAAISKRRVFMEPLVPIGSTPTALENDALSKALDVYQAKGDSTDMTPLLDFLSAHPQSSWRASLLASMGSICFQGGRLTRAIQAWKESLELAKFASTAEEKAVTVDAASRLALLLATLGRESELQNLLERTKGMVFPGSAGDRLAQARGHLEWLQTSREGAMLCGPEALRHLSDYLNAQSAYTEDLNSIANAKQGTNLAQLRQSAKEHGLDLAGIRFHEQDPIPIPSLFYWKAGHFSTVLKREGDRYLVKNFIPGQDVWMSSQAFREEAGGFALVPLTVAKQGPWVSLRESEMTKVWGTGTVTGCGPSDSDNDTVPKSCPAGNPGSPAMATYAIDTVTTDLRMTDTPIWLTTPVGPQVAFTVHYTQRDPGQPVTFTYSNLGPKWNFDWLSYIQDDPASPGLNTFLYWNGGLRPYSNFNSTTNTFDPQYRGKDLLVRVSATAYERRMPDGTKQHFELPDGGTAPRKVFLTRIVDPSGNTLQFNYDAQKRLFEVVDALGRVTRLSYELPTDPLKITKVTDPLGRSATFHYNASFLLAQITDMGGISSTFSYGPTAAAPSAAVDFINALITPYGTTKFACGASGADRWIEVTDPTNNKERVEFRNYTGSMPTSEVVAPAGFRNQYLYYRNTFYWDKRVMAGGAGDWTRATIYHWCHAQTGGAASGTLESLKKPLESRIWNFYNQTDGRTYVQGPSSQPTEVARILDDGTEQRTKTEYNAWGKPTKVTDAAGRVTSYAYSSDGLDLLSVRNTTAGANELLAQYAYNSQHKPLTTTDASGKTTTFSYNAAGQVLSVINPKSETTSFTYEGGFLKTITGATSGATTNFTYDAVGRVRTVTGSDGVTITTDYDDLDRSTLLTYPDGTTEAHAYDKLDLIGSKDRQGRWTRMTYNPLRQLTEIQDAQGRITRFDWCGCGTLEQLTDPSGHLTNWFRDLQGRVIAKQLHDGTKTHYTYDGAGRMIQRLDARGQRTLYSYFPDGNLKQVRYPDALKATPTVTYSYDGKYNRLTSMIDGFGTTSYAYNPVSTAPQLGAGRLASVDGPFSNDLISYTYDDLGRVTTRSVNGVTETRTFDSLGRVGTVTNPLGLFNYAYQGDTGRLDTIILPNGQKTTFKYFDALNQFRLQEIRNQKSTNSPISVFGYTYDVDGQIQTWSQQSDAGTPKVFSFGYDDANQLIGAVLNGPNGELLRQFSYGYDLAGNRTSETIDGATTTATHNGTNQLTQQRFSLNNAALKAIAERKAAAKVKAKANRKTSAPKVVPPPVGVILPPVPVQQ